MYGQLRIAHKRVICQALRVPQRRLLTTPPPPAGTVHVRPVTVNTGPATPGSSSLATPKPKPRRFRRFVIYTVLGSVAFYSVSGYIGTKSDTYRDLFTDYVPGGEAVADYADENGWENLTGKILNTWYSIAGKSETTSEKVERKLGEIKEGVAQIPAQAKGKIEEVRERITEKSSASQKVGDKAQHLKQVAIDKTHEAETRIKEFAVEAKEKIETATKDVPFNFSEGVEGIVRQAEAALHKVESKTDQAVETAKLAPTIPSSRFPDTQRPRELRPETVVPKKQSFEGKQLYTGPPLPLGFEPPPGYYLEPPKETLQEKVKEKIGEIEEKLPLLVPKVKEFAAEEPIISQLASTIDSLTSSLSTPTKTLSSNATGILSKAHDDLTALSTRLQEVKKAEKERLEKTVGEKKKEFEALLKSKEDEKVKSEGVLKQNWEKERQGMVDDWRKELEAELEHQRQGIETRLREEVVSQGIELQRRWLRSIKAQVETERGGRLAKLDHLTTSLKQLERITLDNSATLDDNVRLHKLWSALRAVQSKVDAGDVMFDDELRALRNLAAPTSSQGEGVIKAALDQLEKSGIPQTGVKSFSALSSWFTNSVAPRIQSSSLVPAPEEATVLSHLASALLSKVMFRPQAGRVPGGSVGAVLARAEWCLAEKDLDGAAREVNSLTGWPAKLATDWLVQARRKLEVQQALEVNSLLFVDASILAKYNVGRSYRGHSRLFASGLNDEKQTMLAVTHA
nr:mitochondrial protein [Cryptococcus depauperatus CBS 7855]